MAFFIPEDKISEIKNTINIVDIISETVVLKKSGKNYLGLCPFHSEKTPSFTVSPQKQIFYCFGCGEGGNVFSFLMKHAGLSFPDAARMLAQRYGIEIPAGKMSAEQKKQITEREKLLVVNKHAMEFFRRILLESDSGKKAVTYLNNRGMTQDIIKRFKLGYAPGGWDNTVNYFFKKKISQELVEKSGLIVAKKNSIGFYDRFRERIIFPIFDINGQVIGFGGRVMDDSLPKYLNSPETPVYNKSCSLYGIQRAKVKIRERGSVYIVEGYFDLLALHKHGMENSVATLGTSLTLEHLQILKGFAGRTGKVILVYDSDAAGIKAAQRSIDVFNKVYIDAHVLVLPPGHDPDSYLFEFGANSFLNAASKAMGMMSFLIDSTIKKYGLSIEGKLHIISELKSNFASITDGVARSLYVKQLAERLDINESAILKKFREVSAAAMDGDNNARRSTPFPAQGLCKTDNLNINKDKLLQTKESKLERRIIAMMLQSPEILPEVKGRDLLEYFKDDTLKSIGHTILTHKHSHPEQISEIIALIDDNKRRIVASLAIGEEPWNRKGCLMLIAQFESSRKRLKNNLLREIKTAEQNNNFELLIKLLKDKQIQVTKNRAVASAKK